MATLPLNPKSCIARTVQHWNKSTEICWASASPHKTRLHCSVDTVQKKLCLVDLDRIQSNGITQTISLHLNLGRAGNRKQRPNLCLYSDALWSMDPWQSQVLSPDSDYVQITMCQEVGFECTIPLGSSGSLVPTSTSEGKKPCCPRALL